jgi:hypothetical protein
MKHKRAFVHSLTGGVSLTLALMGATVIPTLDHNGGTEATVAQPISSQEITMEPDDDVKWP